MNSQYKFLTYKHQLVTECKGVFRQLSKDFFLDTDCRITEAEAQDQPTSSSVVFHLDKIPPLVNLALNKPATASSVYQEMPVM